jgi:hypothetical protein
MSSSVRISARQRWSAREVLATKWHKHAGDTFKGGDPLADLSIGGNVRTIKYNRSHGSDPEGGIYWLYVEEGHEVGPWRHLLEYSDWAAGTPGPRVANVNHPQL